MQNELNNQSFTSDRKNHQILECQTWDLQDNPAATSFSKEIAKIAKYTNIS